MKSCVYNLLEEQKEYLIEKYKEANNIQRLTAPRKEVFEKEILVNDEEYQILTELKNLL